MITRSMLQAVSRKNAAGSGGTQVVTGDPTSGTLRNNFTGWVGMRFLVDTEITVTALSRWCVSGNAATHTVGLWTDAGTLLASVSIDASAGAGDFINEAITPVVLSAATYYRIGSAETNGGDQWYNRQSLTVDSVLSYHQAIYGTTTYPNSPDNGGEIYVPVGFIFE